MSAVSEAQLAHFRAHGWFVSDVLFDAAEVARARDEIDRIWRERAARDAVTERPAKAAWTVVRPELPRMHRESDALAALCRHPAFADIARGVLARDADLFWNQVYAKAPGGDARTEIPWHQDAYYATLDAPVYNCWVALTRMTVDNGTMWATRGALDRPVRPHAWNAALSFFACDVDEAEAFPVELEPGQAFVYDLRVAHRSGRNASGAPRVAYSVAFTAAGARLASTGEPFGDRVPIVRAGRRVDDLLADLAGARARGEDTSAHAGDAVLRELAARVPGRDAEIARWFARYAGELAAGAAGAAAATLGRLLAVVPDDAVVNGDFVRSRTRVEHLLLEADLCAGQGDRDGARALLRRGLEVAPGHADVLRALARLG